jgi:hypothetical protein
MPNYFRVAVPDYFGFALRSGCRAKGRGATFQSFGSRKQRQNVDCSETSRDPQPEWSRVSLDGAGASKPGHRCGGPGSRKSYLT